MLLLSYKNYKSFIAVGLLFGCFLQSCDMLKTGKIARPIASMNNSNKHHQIEQDVTEPGVDIAGEYIGSSVPEKEKKTDINGDSEHQRNRRSYQWQTYYQHGRNPFNGYQNGNIRSHYMNMFQSDDPMQNNQLVIPNDSYYNFQSYHTTGSKRLGKFKHYNDFNDQYIRPPSVIPTLPPSLLNNRYNERNKPAIKNNNLNNNSYQKKNYKLLNAPTPTKKEHNESNFPETIMKDGKVFYRQDLTNDGNVTPRPMINKKMEMPTLQISSFDSFTGEAQKLNDRNTGAFRKSFDMLLDHVRQIGSRVPITSAAIATARVKGNNKGMTSYAIGTALNRGYFAAIAKGRNRSGGFTESRVQGDGQGARGSASIASPSEAGNVLVQVDHSHGGIVEGKSSVDRGEAFVYANIDHTSDGQKISPYGQSFGEASSQLYPLNMEEHHQPRKSGHNILRMNTLGSTTEEELHKQSEELNTSDNYFNAEHNRFSKMSGDRQMNEERRLKVKLLREELDKKLLDQNIHSSPLFSKTANHYQYNYRYGRSNINEHSEEIDDKDERISKISERDVNNIGHFYTDSSVPFNSHGIPDEYDSDIEIPDEELYPNLENSSLSYDVDYNEGDFDDNTSVHNIHQSIPKPEPLPLSPLAPSFTTNYRHSTTIKPITDRPKVNEVGVKIHPSVFMPSSNTNSINNLSRSQHDHKGRSSIYRKRPVLPNYPSSASQGSRSNLNEDSPPLNLGTNSPAKRVTSESTNTVQGNDSQMMKMTFLKPDRFGISRFIEPIQPNHPVIKVITMERNSFPNNKGTIIQPGHPVPGAPSYKIPQGFRGTFFLGNYKPQHSNSEIRYQSFSSPKESYYFPKNRLESMNTKQPHRPMSKHNYHHSQKGGKVQQISGRNDCGYYSNNCQRDNYSYSCTRVYTPVICCC